MTQKTTIISGDIIANGSPAQVPCLIVCSSLAAVGSVLALDPGDDFAGQLGAGLAADVGLFISRQTSSRLLAAVAAATWTPAPSVVHKDASGGNSPTGPTVTVALAAGVPGCLDDHTVVVTATSATSATTASIANDGATVAESITIPAEIPAVLRGTAPITPSILAQPASLHFDFTAPAAKVLTFAAGSLPASPAGLLVAAATSLSTITLHVSDLIPAGVAATHANVRRLRFTSAGGTVADVPASVTITGLDHAGATITETLALSQTAGNVMSLKAYDLSTCTIAYLVGQGTGGTVAIGYEDAYASVAELVAAFNALAVAAPLAVLARSADTLTASLLELYSTAAGAGVTMTLDLAASTADGLFGFTVGSGTALTATGAPATYPLPRSGLVLTFPATGPYVSLETYTVACVGPRSSLAAKVAAATAAQAQYNTNAFGFIATIEPIDTAPNVVATVAAFETLRAQWLADPVAPRDIYFAVGGTWHAASPVKATNDAAITAADSALLAALATAASNPNSVVEGDVYIQGAATLALGSFRRSAVVPWIMKRASVPRLAATVSEDSIPEIVLKGPDGLTMARDQNTASIHLDQLDGPGVFVLRTMADGRTVKFALGATCAGKTSHLRHDGDVAVAFEAARRTQVFTELWEGQRPETNTATGMLQEHERASRRDAVAEMLQPFFRPDQGLVNASDDPTVVVLDPPGGLKFTDTGVTPVKVSFVTLGTITEIDITVAATGTSRATTIA